MRKRATGKGRRVRTSKLLLEYVDVLRAGVFLQAAARGYLARCKFRRMLAVHHRMLAEERARQEAALQVISPWARTFSQRCHFLRQRCACQMHED